MAGRGTFIALEGIDGSGKSLQARMLRDHMERLGRKCLLTAEPTDAMLGRIIREELAGRGSGMSPRTLQLLFVADRSWHVEKEIGPWLAKGGVVITDRYYGSTVAYGAALGLDTKWLLSTNSKFPEPDYTFMIKVSPQLAYERRHRRKATAEVLEKIGIQRRAARAYDLLARSRAKMGWHTIDGTGTPGDVAGRILSKIKP